MMIHPNKKNKGQVVPICFVCAIKYNDITKYCIIKQTLSITPEQTQQMSLIISEASEKEISVSAFSFPKVSDDRLSITSSNCPLLMAMAEIIQVPLCVSNFIIPTIRHFLNFKNLVFTDPTNLHLKNISFLLITDSSIERILVMPRGG